MTESHLLLERYSCCCHRTNFDMLKGLEKNHRWYQVHEWGRDRAIDGHIGTLRPWLSQKRKQRYELCHSIPRIGQTKELYGDRNYSCDNQSFLYLGYHCVDETCKTDRHAWRSIRVYSVNENPKLHGSLAVVSSTISNDLSGSPEYIL